MNNFEINVPSDWEIKKISWLFKSVSSGSTPPSNIEEYYYPEDVAWLNTGDLNDGYIERSKKFVSNAALNNFSTLQVYPENSLIMAMYGATIGKLGITNFKTTTNQACCVLAEPQGIEQKFIFYWLLGHREQIIQMSQGGGQPNISQGIIKSIRLGIPDIKVQRKTVEFLDEKYDEINEVILNKEKLIKLLEEKRQTIIMEAVTKGLNPNAKMKYSGVEWIGEIPEHWEVKPLYTIFKENKIKNKGNRYSNVLSLSYGKIKRRDVESNHGLLPDSFETYQILEDGDIVLRLTDLQNDKRSLRVGLVEEKGIITSAYVGLKGTQNMNSKYAYYLLHFYDVVKVFYGLGSGVRQSMGYAELKKMSLIIPPLEEQKQIVEYISIKVIENEQVVDVLKKQIQKLKEYRQSLIYEAVTGKIDVRELVTEK